MSSRGPILAMLALAVSAPAVAQYSGRFGCTGDCSGHEAGYAWAAERGITDPRQSGGRSQSFIEGCQDYALQVQEGRVGARAAAAPTTRRLSEVVDEERRRLPPGVVLYRCDQEGGQILFTNQPAAGCVVIAVGEQE